VEIVETSTRSYEQSTVLPHVLGRVGKITAEKWKVTDENGQTTYPLREKGYNMNDIIGISGLESAYEDELRGKDGVETITRNSDGVIVDTALTTVPEPGHTVQLTIDSRFQKAVDKALAENIDMINRVYNTGSMKAAAGAAVVLDVKDGSVLAASNYPSFDQAVLCTFGAVILIVGIDPGTVDRGIAVNEPGIQRGDRHSGFEGGTRSIQAL